MSVQRETVVCILMRKMRRNCKLKMKLQRTLGYLREEVLATNQHN